MINTGAIKLGSRFLAIGGAKMVQGSNIYIYIIIYSDTYPGN